MAVAAKVSSISSRSSGTSRSTRDQLAVQRLVPRRHIALERAVTLAVAEIVLLAFGARVDNMFGTVAEGA